MTAVKTPCPALLPCSTCKELLPADRFYVLGRKTGGRLDILGRRRASKCPDCMVDAYRMLSPEQKMLYNARNRARAKGLEFNIDLADIVIPETCPVLGVPIVIQQRKCKRTDPQSPNSPSLDRIDSTKGYVKGNVCVISCRANRLKGDATPDEIEAILRYVSSRQVTPASSDVYRCISRTGYTCLDSPRQCPPHK